MIGALNALVAGATPSIYSVTVADTTGGFATIYGYNSGAPFGSAISSQAFKTTTINNVASRLPAAGSPNELGIVLDGSLSQSYFSALLVQRTDGAVHRLATADATFSVFGGGTLTSWVWGSSDPSWTAAGTRFLILYP